MTEIEWKLLIFIKDFTGQGADIFYWFDEQRLIETNAQAIIEYPGAVICHDFWLIRDVLFDNTGTLPNIIIDLDEFHISTSGIPRDRLAREKHDITALLTQHGAEREICSAYKRMFNKGIPFELEVASKAAAALRQMYID